MSMKKWRTTGFIGAGKVGFTLGRYFKEHDIDVSGYYSTSEESAREAAEFTGSKCYKELTDLVRNSEVIFITVPDGQIKNVWEELVTKPHELKNKIVCHCSGALSSEIFSDIGQYGAYGYSIHPLFAVNDKYRSYRELSKCLFTIEGSEDYREYFQNMFAYMGNPLQAIGSNEKVRYHAAAAMASNLMVGLVHLCQSQLEKCGFSKENAELALTPLMVNNLEHIVEEGCVQALTGPLERNDVSTVNRHLSLFEGHEATIYRELSREILEVARVKNPERNYSEMEEILKR